MKTEVTQPHTIMGVQFNSRVGGLKANAAVIRQHILAARGNTAPTVLVFPEMALVGYPLQDQVLTDAFIADAWQVLAEDILPCLSASTAAVIGLPLLHNGRRYNAAVFASGGKVLHVFTKVRLPNDSVFDEVRVFTSGKPSVFTWQGITYGVPICEDVWHPEVCLALKALGAQILLSPNASPYNFGKWQRRRQVLDARVAATGLPLLYLNRWGGQDELVFDGQSALLLPGREPLRAAMYADATITFAFNGTGVTGVAISHPFRQTGWDEECWQHLLTGMDYVASSPNGKATLGLSGGVDSALVYALAVSKLGVGNVLAISMPSRFSSTGSQTDAHALVEALGGRMVTIGIEDTVQALRQATSQAFGPPQGTADENLQARVRGVINMLASNMGAGWVLTTGNKSEMAVGYATLYGDMNGAFNPIKDLYKTEVFRLTRWLAEEYRQQGNTAAADALLRICDKPPSAELRENQQDSDSLPPYDVLDAILFRIIEQRQVPREIAIDGVSTATIQRVYNLVDMAEFKRRQACPGIRCHGGDLDKDRRFPLDKSSWKPLEETPSKGLALMAGITMPA